MGLTDFYTKDREFADVMLSEYPGIIFENQYQVIKKDKDKLFCFLDLEYDTLMDFLQKHNVIKNSDLYTFNQEDLN